MPQKTSTDTYIEDPGADYYLEFINSPDGLITQTIQGDAIASRLNPQVQKKILDAACGPGWLSGRLSGQGYIVKSCDASPKLINYARQNYSGIDFQIADLTKTLPYQDNEFDAVIISMAVLDLHNQPDAFQNIKRVLKPNGKLIILTVNPYYAYPVGVWKRGLGALLGKNPRLCLRPYKNFLESPDKKFTWGQGKLSSYFYTLPEQINLLLEYGFQMSHMSDIMSKLDDKKYSLRYRLHRFPIFILLEFNKN